MAPPAPIVTRAGLVPALAPMSVTAVRQDRHRSWVSPDVKGAPRLLFISDFATGVVDIFTMPDLTLKGTLTGYSFPEGMCTNRSGNIWVADEGNSRMRLISRIGNVLDTLNTPGEFPVGCAFNSSNGDLAVINIETTSYTEGNITVYPHGSHHGTAYTNPNIFAYFYAGYDPNGNLFFDGRNASDVAYVAELPAGSAGTQTIALSGGTLHYPGMVQWYNAGSYLALGDQQCNSTNESCVYWVSIAGSSGTITGTTNLNNSLGTPVCDLNQGVIAANGERYLAGPDYESCGATPSSVYRWAYDAGGDPTNFYSNTTSGLVEPLGAAISTK
jgi:hypothetical protein